MTGKNRFEGWYFKQQADGGAVAFIPAHHADESDASASLQIVTEKDTICVPYAANALFADRRGPRVVLGQSVFSSGGLHLDVHAGGADVSGDLVFRDPIRLRYDIMGRFPMCRFWSAATACSACGTTWPGV
jgi:hypothetical protein